MKLKQTNTSCIQRALVILGDKWTPLIIRKLVESPSTFSSIESSLDGISPRTLSQRLDMLDEKKIIKKKCYCDHPPRFEYVLTDKGHDLGKVLASMSDWGAKYPS